MSDLKPAAELAAAASKPFPGDSAEYRRARTALLAEEIELRRHIERVAAQRRTLPLGGEVRDYVFRDEAGNDLRMADLFGEHDTLVTYTWCSARNAPAPARCAPISSTPSTARCATSRSASPSWCWAARRSRASSSSRASAVGAT